MRRRAGPGRKDAPAGEVFPFTVGKPVFAERAKQAEAAEMRRGEDNFLDKDIAGFVHYGALQLFFGAEVREEAAFADAEGRGELTDGEAFEAFQGGDVDGPAEDGAAGFEAAGAARAARDGGASWARVHFDAHIIARPFVLLPIVYWAQNAAPGDGGAPAERGACGAGGAELGRIRNAPNRS